MQNQQGINDVGNLVHDPYGTLKPLGILREFIVNGIIYDLGLSWRLYRWYQRGGSARALSMFLGQNIKFWRDFL